MTFKQIEFFVLVCQYKSIARVSELNYVSPQSISRMIKDLETELQATLFLRTSTGIIPTEIGLYFQEECMQLLEKKENFTKNILAMNKNTKTNITIGMVMGSLAALNYHIFDEFEANHPNIEILYAEFIDDELEEHFSNDKFDFCISTKPLLGNQYESIHILSEQVYLSIPEEHDLYQKDSISMSDLEKYDFAMFTDAFHIRKKFMACFDSLGLVPRIKIASSDFNSIKNLAYQNNLLSLDVQHSLKKEHGFRHVLFPCPDLTYELWIVRKTNHCSDITQELFTYLKNISH